MVKTDAYESIIMMVTGPNPEVRQTGGLWISGPLLISNLIGNAVWEFKGHGIISFAYREEDWALIPEELKKIVDSMVNSNLQTIFDIAKRNGFDSDRYRGELLTRNNIDTLMEDFERALDKAEKDRQFRLYNTWKEWFIFELARSIFKDKREDKGANCEQCKVIDCEARIDNKEKKV